MGSIKMDSKKKETARVYKQQQIAPGIYDMWITTTLAAQAKPDLLQQTESGNMVAGQPGNYGLIVGIVLLSAVVGAVCIFDLVRYL